MAAARFSATTGDGHGSQQQVVQRGRPRAQSVSSQVGASACTAPRSPPAARTAPAPAPAAPRAPAPRPSRDRARRPTAQRSWSSSSTSRPAGVDGPGRAPASVSSSSASSPRPPRSSGISSTQHPRQVDRPARPGRGGPSPSPDGAVCPVVNSRCTTVSTASSRSGSSARRRHPVGDARGGDLLLRPGDPGRHGRLADQERARDLGGRQAADQPQGQRRPAPRRASAGWQQVNDQPQPVVGDQVVVRPRRRAGPGSASARPAAAACPAHRRPARRTSVQRLAAGGRGQPRARAARDAVDAPRSAARRRRRPGRTPRARSRSPATRTVAASTKAHSRRCASARTVRTSSSGVTPRTGPRTCPARAAPRRRHRRPGTAAPARGVVQVAGLDQVEPAERLLGLHERAVGDDVRRGSSSRWPSAAAPAHPTMLPPSSPTCSPNRPWAFITWSHISGLLSQAFSSS